MVSDPKKSKIHYYNTCTRNLIYSAGPLTSYDLFFCPAVYIMIHDQFVWLSMQRLSTNIIPLWRVLFVGRMHGHLNASEENGCSRGAIGFQRDLTTFGGDFLRAVMMFDKYSEHRKEGRVSASFLQIRG